MSSSSAYHQYLASPAWQAKRRQRLFVAFDRCEVCNDSRQLQVHHRTYDRVGREEISDLLVLCAECHRVFHENRRLS